MKSRTAITKESEGKIAKTCSSNSSERNQIRKKERKKNLDHFSICACHPCAGAMLIFSVSFQFYRMSPKRQKPMRVVVYINHVDSIYSFDVGFASDTGSSPG